MPLAEYHHQGYTEHGHVVDPSGAATDTKWGEATEDGVQLQLSTQAADLWGGASLMKLETAVTRVMLALQIAMANAAAQALQRALGSPAADFSGDLEGASPTDESFDFTKNIGSEVLPLYVLGPGPVTTARLDAGKCKLQDLGGAIRFAKEYSTYTPAWEILDPADGSAPATLVYAAA